MRTNEPSILSEETESLFVLWCTCPFHNRLWINHCLPNHSKYTQIPSKTIRQVMAIRLSSPVATCQYQTVMKKVPWRPKGSEWVRQDRRGSVSSRATSLHSCQRTRITNEQYWACWTFLITMLLKWKRHSTLTNTKTTTTFPRTGAERIPPIHSGEVGMLASIGRKSR